MTTQTLPNPNSFDFFQESIQWLFSHSGTLTILLVVLFALIVLISGIDGRRDAEPGRIRNVEDPPDSDHDDGDPANGG